MIQKHLKCVTCKNELMWQEKRKRFWHSIMNEMVQIQITVHILNIILCYYIEFKRYMNICYMILYTRFTSRVC